jgi:hypothetical protein
MLHIAALFVAGEATLDDDGAINATRIPTTCFEVDQVPLWTEIPVVLVVHAPAGGDYDPSIYMACKSPDGAPCGVLQTSWHWPDDGDRPSKYRCFTQQLPFGIQTEGEYTVGVYYDEQANIEMATPVPVSIALTATSPAADSGADA